MASKKKAKSPAPTGRELRRSMSIGAEALPAGAATFSGLAADDPRISSIQAAKEAAELVLAELLHRADDVITADQMAELEPDIQLARNTIEDCRQKEIDLTAADTTFPPLDPASAAKLQQLARQIDAATGRAAIVTASLDGLASILNTAIRINAVL
ncbi:MAG: hypothetical protein M3Z23_07910 [Acidobacteriota bacterium]|nr:hypothetical protein [Acidobacteriota bacterium]